MKNKTSICYGAGLLALDILFRSSNLRDIRYYVGGSCGNVMMILSHLGWGTYPIGRLHQDKYAARIVRDLVFNNVNTDFVSIDMTGSTPIIIQRNTIDRAGNPKHRFDIVHPITGEYLPRYKGITKKNAEYIIQETKLVPDYFYFDRVSPGILLLVEYYKKRGSIIIFEPSSRKNKDFEKALELTDILKFSDQRIPDFKEVYPTAIAPIEIETKGSMGLFYRCRYWGKNWKMMPPYKIPSNMIVDTSGAGDWTTAGIVFMLNQSCTRDMALVDQNELERALEFGQKLGAKACLYEGARGLMVESRTDILEECSKV